MMRNNLLLPCVHGRAFLNLFILITILLGMPLFDAAFGGIPLLATEYHVKQDGSGDFTTIQEAANTAQAGDTVIIHKGVYPELVQPLNSGAAGSPITYRNETGELVIIDGEAGTRDVCIKVQECSYLRFEGLTLRGGLWAGFYAEGPADHLVLDGLTCEDNIHPLRGAGYGIWFMAYDAPISDCEIVNNEVRHNSSHGIFLYRSNYDILIDGNHVSYSGFEENHWGHNVKTVVWNEDDPATGPVGITITNNHLERAITQGIMTWNARQVLIRGNHLHHNGATAIQIEDGTTGFVVEDNLCEWNQQNYSTETGIWIDDASSGVVQNNVLRNNQVGLKVSKCGHVIIRRNLIYENNRKNTDHYHNGGVFLLAYDSTTNLDTIFVHNTLHQIGNPAYANAMLGLYEYYGDTIEDASFVNNIFSETVSGRDLEVSCLPHGSIYDSDYNDFFTAGGLEIYWLGSMMTWEEYRAASGQDAHSINADPLFADAVTGDFGLQTESPCTDAGAPLAFAMNAGSGTTVPVDDARFFTDGFGLIEGDLVMVGDAGPVRVAAVDYATNMITVSESISWTGGDGISYPFSGAAPDMGAIESIPIASTVSATLGCVPSSGTLPFSSTLWVTLTNLYPDHARRIAARLDLSLASGNQISGWRSGWTNIPADSTFNRSWLQALPAVGSLAGDNGFTLIAEDVTYSPYNQPPHPPAGDTDTESCTVTGALPRASANRSGK